ncbi:unnamed protein product [Rotaria sp. Silwood1]|nr:unnamed protein product [Rotaria sp. Silwood1]
MTSLKLILFILAYIVINVKGICDRQSGPVGSIECSFNPDFDKKQWNTCLTNNYIQRQSQGREKCADQTDIYCTYACMPEVYYVRDGNVVDTCACNDSLVPPTSSLPTECLSPDGSNCDWYKNCLERKYSCQGSSTEHLFMYTTIFCNLYIKHKNVFTDRALRWINDGRKCLQVALVPFIRPFVNGTCQEIHDAAFDAFKSCNIKPYPEEGSICDMTRRDWLRAFWMMKSEYSVLTSTAAYAWLQNALDTFYECQNDPQANDFGHVYQEFKLTIDLIQTSWNNQINLNKNQFDQIAVDIAHRIAKFLMAPSERWGWYAYGIPLSIQRSISTYKQMTIALLVADLPGIINDTLIPPVNITNIEFKELIQKLKNTLVKGDLQIQNDNGIFYVSQMGHCIDMKCHATIEDIVAPPYDSKSNSNKSCFSMMSLLLVTLIFFL